MSSTEAASRRHWDELHTQRRFLPRFPNDHVVRFVLGSFPDEPRTRLRALDIGVGGGRHTKLLVDLGFQVAGIDLSQQGLNHCRGWLADGGQHAWLGKASMSELPFADQSFDTAIAFGVYYYADLAGMKRSIAELRRVLREGAPALIVLRTTADYRAGKGSEVEAGTYQLTIADTNEQGSIQHFVSESELPSLFAAYSQLRFEKTETTFGERTQVNSDWLIQVRR